MKIKITKLSELEDALHKNNIEEGYEQIYEIEERYFEEPMLDRRFNVSEFSSSGVQKIIDKTNIPENDVRAILDEMRNVFQGKSQIM